jgi:hypothetical protein
MVQQVQGESQGKQPAAEPSTPYSSSTFAPGNTNMLYQGNTTALCNIASTSTLHPGKTSGNVIYVDTSWPYLGGVSMGNPSSSPTAKLPYPGGTSTSGNLGFPAHSTPTNPNPNFQQPYYQTMAYGPNIPPSGTGAPHGPIPNIFFPRTLSYITPNPRVEGEVNNGVRDQIARTLREFGFTPKVGLGPIKSHIRSNLTRFLIHGVSGYWIKLSSRVMMLKSRMSK